ncbi:conserved hypothetical protein [Ricinus communis]|uniref:RNase H type-1 domain-containing protein n=1 Tax=Ricinus communis TaxID=3988 RepID=B9S892_RICCO|nr:conserved hypothetical protein [Ricinus communis]
MSICSFDLAYLSFRVESRYNSCGRYEKLGDALIALPFKWSSPPSGFIKINTDTTIDGNRGSVGAGAVVRDQAGSVLFSLQKRVSLRR